MEFFEEIKKLKTHLYCDERVVFLLSFLRLYLGIPIHQDNVRCVMIGSWIYILLLYFNIDDDTFIIHGRTLCISISHLNDKLIIDIDNTLYLLEGGEYRELCRILTVDYKDQTNYEIEEEEIN